jgi:N-methylhydantoinase A/oxoprolinase/acetone carboxylase beta subunit
LTSPSDDRLRLGFDTGGTYTDAVLFSPARGVIASAKSLTTRHDLSIGITGAASAVIAMANIKPSDIGLVSMSTTLATNALVEGQGGRVALIGIGFEPNDLTRGGLVEALGKDPLILIAGGHDASGRAKPLDLEALEKAIVELGDTVTGIAIAALFAVRNPAHEIAARELVHRLGDIPVTLSHELSSKLGGPRRALTTLLNARLVGLIGRLIAATQGFLQTNDIHAPLMVVRGDGALVSAAFAADRPIETILSGPAASLVGAQFLTGLQNAIISDIGGTTTDIALLTDGRPRLDDEGATVGGFRTMVEAVAMRTHGLGGDSEVTVPDGGLDARLVLGPRRIVPLALVDTANLPVVTATLEQQLKSETQNRLDGRFAFRTGLADRFAAGLSSSEAALYAKLTTQLQPLTQVISSAPQLTALNRLVVRGLAMICGFTPTDAQHVLGRQTTGERAVAELGATLFARKRDGRGLAICEDANAMSLLVVQELERKSAELILEAAFGEDGMDGVSLLKSPLVQRAMAGQNGIARLSLTLDRPVIGLGASAPLVYPQVGTLLKTDAVIPQHADVANAVGAVVGEVRVKVTAHVSQPDEGVFVVSVADMVKDFRDEASALKFAVHEASKIAMQRADIAGASDAHVDLSEDIKAATIEGQRKFIEATVEATAHGRPRLGQ